MSLFKILPDDIINLIECHLKALIIQSIFKINRPLTNFSIGDRIKIINKKNNNNFCNYGNYGNYGTILLIKQNYCIIQLLPRIIPHWKRCNLLFWKNYQRFINNFNFPYYIPKPINVSKKKLIKLNDWKTKMDNISFIDGTKRINSHFSNLPYNNTYFQSSIFQYCF